MKKTVNTPTTPRRATGRPPGRTNSTQSKKSVAADLAKSNGSSVNVPTNVSGVDPTINALKDVYQALHAEFSRLADDAQQRLTHVEALLSLSTSSIKLSIPAFETAAVGESESNIEVPLPTKGRRGGRRKAVVEEVSVSAVVPTPAPKAAKQPRGKQAVKVEGESKRRTGLKLVKPYQDSTMLDALSKALEDRKGLVVSADSLVEALYGDLKLEQFKLAKDRVTKSLSKGKMEGRWDRVPDKIGCYTLSMKLVNL